VRPEEQHARVVVRPEADCHAGRERVIALDVAEQPRGVENRGAVPGIDEDVGFGARLDGKGVLCRDPADGIGLPRERRGKARDLDHLHLR
jgi:hypothetical protein